MSFAVLPRRDTNPDITETRPEGPSTMALESSALAGPLLELVGIETVDAAAGVVELPVREWAMNSMGALQGGIVGAVVEAAAEVALRVGNRPAGRRHRCAAHVPGVRQGRSAAHARRRHRAQRDARGRAGRARRRGRRGPADGARARRRDEVARVTQTPANMGTDIMRFAAPRHARSRGAAHRRRRPCRRPSARSQRCGARRRAPHHARLRRWRLRWPRITPRRLGRVHEPVRAHRAPRADGSAQARFARSCARAATTS